MRDVRKKILKRRVFAVISLSVILGSLIYNIYSQVYETNKKQDLETSINNMYVLKYNTDEEMNL